jgi:hypothetical protein
MNRRLRLGAGYSLLHGKWGKVHGNYPETQTLPKMKRRERRAPVSTARRSSGQQQLGLGRARLIRAGIPIELLLPAILSIF